MTSHLKPYFDKYPQHAPVLNQVYLDLVYVKEWVEVIIKDIESLRKCIILARSKPEQTQFQVVVPCSLLEKWSIRSLLQVMDVIPSHLSAQRITLAITSTDSTIVYYKIAHGLAAPNLADHGQKNLTSPPTVIEDKTDTKS
ncbi:8150_t:CDS:2 [Paraglomus occultum]|uniref:8150_t:CDS:1 n=1 Tax=Paraglomus occultum TaxID=144539 RepID=A0A9N9GU80_9GLOM|nr:8150_t:CDS:2 [Paraglomus occultum]